MTKIDSKERQWYAAPLSPQTRARIFVDGPMGRVELDHLIALLAILRLTSPTDCETEAGR